MLSLETHANIEGLESSHIYKLLSIDEALEYNINPKKIALFDDDFEKMASLGNFRTYFGAVVSKNGNPSPASFEEVWIHSLIDSTVLNYGDVFRASPINNVIKVLFRRASKQNVLFVTNQCNSRCLMCSQPPTIDDDRWLRDELKELVPLIDKNVSELGITGGEPTLHKEDLISLLKLCKDHLPDTTLHILTNGRAFSDFDIVQSLAEIQHPKVVWAIPLYSDCDDIHDYVVQAKGAFKETVKGMYHLGKFHQSIEIRMVLNKQSIPRLSNWAYFIFRNLPFVKHIAVMGLEPYGYAKPNKDLLLQETASYVNILEESVFFLNNRGLNVSIYNLPLCVLPQQLWQFAKPSISDWKNKFLDECASCDVQDSCCGFFAWAKDDWISENVHAIKKEEIENKHFLIGSEHEILSA